jgi:hypothetical protein
MRSSTIRCLVVAASVVLAGCFPSEEWSEDFLLRENVTTREGAIYLVNVFSGDRKPEVVDVLKKEWDEPSPRSWGSEPAVKATLAFNLAKLDPNRRDEYFIYLAAQSKATEERVAQEAVVGLGRIDGVDSLKVLISTLGDSRVRVVQEVLKSIEFRIRNLDGHPALQTNASVKAERDYLWPRIHKLCKLQDEHPLFPEFCERIKDVDIDKP